MDNVARLRRARHEAVKLQRRIWLAQIAFWPAVVLAFGLIAVLGVRWLQRRHRTATEGAAPSRPPAQDARAS